MDFDAGAVARFRRYRKHADATLGDMRLAEEAARAFCERFFEELEYCTRYANEAGFEASTDRSERRMRLKLSAAEGAGAEVVFARLEGAAHETEEFLLHETLSRHTLPSEGYSGRVLGWAPPEEEPCQTFSVYRDGSWRTTGLLVERSRGKTGDPKEVLRGFCLRILGRVVDLCAPTDGVGRVWRTEKYRLSEYGRGAEPPVETRWLK
ncbi:hypothetical protein [Rubrobacter indicoceani]|uniref:hypothetical protein n=1 Tax=Rubrobacter indicoceani TaxID=2051957 RepID=UPI000E5AC955|nr:hypothetical protein [Rubrobacter indicoceani]